MSIKYFIFNTAIGEENNSVYENVFWLRETHVLRDGKTLGELKKIQI